MSIGVIASIGFTSSLAIPQVKMGLFAAGSGGNFRANPNEELEWVTSNYIEGISIYDGYIGTFCIEYNEYFGSGGVYDVVLNNGSVNGGISGAFDGKDVISVGTAFLYEEFVRGTLAGFSYGLETSAKQLQNTIWYLEGERELGVFAYGGVGGYGTFLDLAESLSGYQNDYTGNAVKVMNLTSNNGQNLHQDQLVYTGVSDTGATLALLAIGLFGLTVVRRYMART